jgi:hypothetical protein
MHVSSIIKEDIMHFRIRGLPAETFAPLFHLSGAELRQHSAVRCIADGPRPCRISFTDARPGDELILVNYEHHAVASPYRMRFAIYVRKNEETFDAVYSVPEQLRTRTLAVRSFDAEGMMTGWELAERSSVNRYQPGLVPRRPAGRSLRRRPRLLVAYALNDRFGSITADAGRATSAVRPRKAEIQKRPSRLRVADVRLTFSRSTSPHRKEVIKCAAPASPAPGPPSRRLRRDSLPDRKAA